ncbi:PREDICTED: G2/mitotic-specific cyclin-B1-like, partial [Leptosomus discolor]|uniref:G2/mitotic-specific cyclin-B1-like n=1 Tax=Leptosomus discolor TaxID=188344 RepID=UPI00052248E5
MASELVIRRRTALRDIGNRAARPKTWAITKKAVEKGSCQEESSTRALAVTTLDKTCTRSSRAATDEELQSTAMDPKPEPSQLKPQSPTLMETPGCAPPGNVLYQAFSDVLLDVEDDNDPNTPTDYVKDIYKYLRKLEENQPVRPNYLASQAINGDMRAVLIDWLVDVQMKFQLLQETLYLAVAIIDRFLQDNSISTTMLQLVGVTAMLIACKYEEIVFPDIEDFAYITDHAYTKSQILQMERKILQALDFSLGCPLPLHFLSRTSKIAKVSPEQHVLANYLMELSIVDYDMVHIPPSKIAAAASCLSLKLSGCEWTPTLQHNTSYTENDLLPVMQHMAKNIVLMNMDATQLMTIKKKYDILKNHKLLLTDQLGSSIVRDLA